MSDETSQIHSTLRSLRLLHHEKNFLKHGVESLDDLILLSREDLSELGVAKVGERNRLWAWIQDHQVNCSQPAPSSFEDSAVVLGKKGDKSSRDEIAESVRNLAAQAKSLIGSTTSPMTINVSMKVDGQPESQGKVKKNKMPSLTSQRHLQSSRSISKQKSTSSLFFRKKDGKDLSPPRVRSLQNQTNEDKHLKESKSFRTLFPGSSQRQSMTKQKSTPILVSHKKDGKEPSFQRTRSHRSQTSKGQITKQSNQRVGVAKQKSSPLLVQKENERKERSFPLTQSSRSLTKGADGMKETKTLHRSRPSNPSREEGMRKHKSVPLLMPAKQYEKDSSSRPRLSRSPRRQPINDDNITEKPNRREQPSTVSPAQHKSVSNGNKSQGKIRSVTLISSSNSETTSTDDMTENKTVRRANHSNQMKQQGIHQQSSAPLLLPAKHNKEGSSLQSTRLPRQQPRNDDSMSEKLNGAGQHSGLARNYRGSEGNSDPQLTHQQQRDDDFSKDTPLGKTQAASSQSVSENKSLSVLIHDQDRRGNSSPPLTSSSGSQATSDNEMMESKALRGAQHSSLCEDEKNLSLVSTKYACADPSYLSKDSSHRQTFEDDEDDITEADLSRAEQYMVESNFMHTPDISGCKDNYCCAIFDFLMLDKDLVKLFAEMFFTTWLKAANKEDDSQDFDRDAVVDVSIGTFTKIAHRYSHKHAVELCNLPNDEAASRVREFRKAALVWACKTSVDDILRSKEDAHMESKIRTIESLDVVSGDGLRSLSAGENDEVDTITHSHDMQYRHVTEVEHVDDSITSDGKKISPKEVYRSEQGGVASSQYDASGGDVEKKDVAEDGDVSPEHISRNVAVTDHIDDSETDKKCVLVSPDAVYPLSSAEKEEVDASEISYEVSSEHVAVEGRIDFSDFEEKGVSPKEVGRSEQIGMISSQNDATESDADFQDVHRNWQSRTGHVDNSEVVASVEKKEVDTSERSYEINFSVTSEEEATSPERASRSGQRDLVFSQDDVAKSDVEKEAVAEKGDTSFQKVFESWQSRNISPQSVADSGHADKSETDRIYTLSKEMVGNDESNDVSSHSNALKRDVNNTVASDRKKVSPKTVYQTMKVFWQSALEKEPGGVFPEAQPFYKSDDPHVHPPSTTRDSTKS